MPVLKTSIFLLIFLPFLLSLTDASELPVPYHEEALRKFLLENYDSISLPDKKTNVSIRVTIRHIDMNEGLHAVELDGWVVMKWHDPRLKWQTKKHDEITKLAIKVNNIWRPDILLYNNADNNNNINMYGDTLALVYPTGDVMHVPPVHFKASCVMDLTYWPYDEHNCTVKFGSWVYSGYEIDLIPMDDKPTIDQTELHREYGANLTRNDWEIKESSVTRHSTYYSCCSEPYISIILQLVLKRHAPTLFWTIQAPVVALGLLTIIVFLLPVEAKEKVVFGGLVLACNLIFLQYVAGITKASGSHTPLIVQLSSLQLVLSTMSVMVCCVILRMVEAPYTSRLTPVLQRIIKIIASCLFISSYRTESPDTVTGFSRTSMKPDDVELNDGEVNLCSDGSKNSKRVVSEWVLLGAILDRVFLILYCFIFFVNILRFASVL